MTDAEIKAEALRLYNNHLSRWYSLQFLEEHVRMNQQPPITPMPPTTPAVPPEDRRPNIEIHVHIHTDGRDVANPVEVTTAIGKQVADQLTLRFPR